MNSDAFITRLETNADAIRRLVCGVPGDRAKWRFAPSKWSILEVAAHLLDEEREDFRVRLDLLLHKPEAEWPPIDPQGWVTAREYDQKDLDETIDAFMKERVKSIKWLRGLESPDWETKKEHPVVGSMTAGDIFAAWVGHDFLHIRQLARIHWELITDGSQPHSPAYAGDW